MAPEKIPSRVVSLVPSLTESLFELGLGGSVVGITDYCVHPQGKLDGILRVGGPGDARLESILALKPDLVLAGREENRKETIHSLEHAGIRVMTFFPKTIEDGLQVLADLATQFHSDYALLKMKALEAVVEWQAAAALSRTPLKVFCPIWQEIHASGLKWWMTFNQDTYCDAVFRLFGGMNVFASRLRRYPLEADLGLTDAVETGDLDTRYPRITNEEIAASGAEMVLFPSEPYPFGDVEIQDFCKSFPGLPAVHSGRIYAIDGSLISWYGTRLALSLETLAPLFDL